MPKTIDVSILIPSFNSEPFLKRSILSCLSQTGVSVEVIVIDDEGTDRTRDILETIMAGNPGVPLRTIYRESGLGQATARNDGMKVATGRYIAFLDSDDSFCTNTVLAEWVAEADAQKLQMSVARFYNVSQTMVRNSTRRIDRETGGIYSLADAPELVNVVSCWQILYNRAFLEDNGVIFSPKLRQREDRLFVIEAMLKADCIGVSDLFVVDHFNVDDSSFKQINPDQLEQYVQHMTELNAALAQARAGGRSNPDFERANAIIYVRQLDEYWSKLVQNMAVQRDYWDLLGRYLRQLRTLVQDLPPFYHDTVLEIVGNDGFLREGRMDLLRLVIKSGDREQVNAVLKERKPSISHLRALREVDESSDEIVTRLLSFQRGGRRNFLPAPTLEKLVRRVVVHTGLTKTGSSTLQHMMERNRYALMEQGIHYPVAGTFREYGARRERTPGHASLFGSILDGKTESMDMLREELNDISTFTGQRIDTLVLSSENIVSSRFWNGGANFAKMLSPFIGVETVDVAFVLRHPLSWLRSQYIELAGNPWNQFVDTLEDFSAQLDEQGLLNFEAIVAALEAPEVVDTLHVGIYEKIREAGGTEAWFFDLIGCDSSGFAPIDARLRNDSLSPAQAMQMRVIKSFGALDRDDLGLVFEQIRADGTKTTAPTPQFVAGLESFRESHGKTIADHEARYQVAAPPVEKAPAFEDLETKIDAHMARLRQHNIASLKYGSEEAGWVLNKLETLYRNSSEGRMIRMALEGRAQCAYVILRPGERFVNSGCRLITPAGEHPLVFTVWDDQGVCLLDQGYVRQLWYEQPDEIRMEVTTTQRTGSRRFRAAELLHDRTCWLVPVTELDKMQENTLSGHWRLNRQSHSSQLGPAFGVYRR